VSIAEACERAGRGDVGGSTVQDHEIKVLDHTERPVQAPRLAAFEQVQEFPPELQSELKKAGFPGPSQIQAYCWPLALQGRDVIGIAATGSGKTLAFLLPGFCELHRQRWQPRSSGPGILVMSPTRELAQQIEKEAARFGACLGMRCVSMYGGASKGDQMRQYRTGVHAIVACPGRLNDFLETNQVRVDGISKLVLDEADRMLDMGFEPQIRKILEKIPRQRQTLFFTATWPKEVRKLAAEILSYPFKVMIGNRDLLKGNQDVIQQVRMVESAQKDRAIVDLLTEAGLTRRESCGKALVFANTKKMCEDLSNMLYKMGVPCASIHGDKDQYQRDDALNKLKSGRIKVLVATDVAARGLDIKGVGLVVNYDAANSAEDYVHRIGRTGRAGAKGFSVTFIARQDAGKARDLVQVMERTGQQVPKELRDLSARGGGYNDRRDRWRGGGGGGGGGKSSGKGGGQGGGGGKGGKGGKNFGKGAGGGKGSGQNRNRSRSPRR